MTHQHHEGFILWFTGLSGAGKSTLANRLVSIFKEARCNVELLDGDEVRTNLSKGLGFSKEDRDTNIRRIGYVCELLARNGVIAISAAISPYREIRDELRHQSTNFIEVFADCTLDTCIERDVKGLYEKALKGEIKNFTGVSDPYEAPENPEITVRTHQDSIDACVEQILNYLQSRDLIRFQPEKVASS